MNNNKQEIEIDLPEAVSDGQYANLAIISHSPTEFIVDFINMMPGVPKGKVKSRIILNPVHAKRLLKALNDNVLKYEKNFGVINDNIQPEIDLTRISPKGNA